MQVSYFRVRPLHIVVTLLIQVNKIIKILQCKPSILAFDSAIKISHCTRINIVSLKIYYNYSYGC